MAYQFKDINDAHKEKLKNYNIKKTVSGSITYFGKADPGMAESSPYWQCFKIDKTSGMKLTWADGDDEFDNIATDLTSLNYL